MQERAVKVIPYFESLDSFKVFPHHVDKIYFEDVNGVLSDLRVVMSDGQELTCFGNPCLRQFVSLRDVERISVTFGKAERFVYFITIVYRNKTSMRIGKETSAIPVGRVETF